MRRRAFPSPAAIRPVRPRPPRAPHSAPEISMPPRARLVGSVASSWRGAGARIGLPPACPLPQGTPRPFPRGVSEPGVSLRAHRRRYSRASLRDYPYKPRAGGPFHLKFARLGKCKPFRRSVALVASRRAFPAQPLQRSGRHQAALHGMPPSPRRAGGPGAGAHVVPQPPRHAPAVGRPYLTWAGGRLPFQEACACGSQGSGNGLGCPFAHSPTRPVTSSLPGARGAAGPHSGAPPGHGRPARGGAGR